MRELLLLGFITLAFGLGTSQTLGDAGPLAVANIVVGVAALASGGFIAVRRLARVRQASSRMSLVESILGLVAIIWGVWIVQSLAATTGARWDWTFESQYDLSPSIRDAVQLAKGPIALTLYREENDPRIRRTRLLLNEIATLGDVIVRDRLLDNWPDDEDRFGIPGSNTVVVEYGQAWEMAAKPTEGALFEAISQLVRDREQILYIGYGTGEGDIESTSDLGYSGLASALYTEGYILRQLATALISEIPEDADCVIL